VSVDPKGWTAVSAGVLGSLNQAKIIDSDIHAHHLLSPVGEVIRFIVVSTTGELEPMMPEYALYGFPD